jgi:nucleotide-binding universal stress UspA family protein
MKLLIGYDGSKSADAALDDLRRAGLPNNAEALILSVAEIWMPPPTIGYSPSEYHSEVGSDWIEKHQKIEQVALKEAAALCRHAAENLQAKFPGWKIYLETTCGSPARKILEKADEFRPHLIVIGAQGNNALSRLFLGSISGKILSEAKCSVRVARGRTALAAPPSPARLILGFDGLPGAEAAINAVIAGNWDANTEIRLVTAIDAIVPESIGRFMSSSIVWVEEEIQMQRRWIEKIAHHALQELRAAGFTAELCVRDENPKQMLVDEAQKWNADCIFLGANSCSDTTENTLIGSISAAVAERASCSVEIVRNISRR